MPQKEINSIIENADYHGNHKINYTEFLAATMKLSEQMTDERLWILFSHFDTDGSGKITGENLK